MRHIGPGKFKPVSMVIARTLLHKKLSICTAEKGWSFCSTRFDRSANLLTKAILKSSVFTKPPLQPKHQITNMLKQQHKRKSISRRGHSQHTQSSHFGHHNSQKIVKCSSTPILTVTSIQEFPPPVTFGSFDYPLPTQPTKVTDHHINELPKFVARPAAQWKGKPLGSTFQETISGVSISRQDVQDPVMTIVMSKRKQAKQLKLGSMEIDIYSKRPLGANKFINKFIQKESLVATPMKRIRDELVDVSSSIKKNKRIVSVTQADTTMELSFEGKAMDKSDLVKLVDSSGFAHDDSHLVDADASIIDTSNILQNTEFSFEFRR